ncbi:MAG TPA: ABC transporter permease [Thermoanaerobaculia bacterium]|nr:ABC transporter permease [Thermoanaerobaculia bacterium]
MTPFGLEILRLTGQHVLLVLASVGSATLIGFPLALLCTRRRTLRAISLRFVDTMQTVPSLALFGLLIPLPLIGGIGAQTAIVALILYSLLPIVRTTILGIESVDPLVREVGSAIGMTDRQLLWQVELPLAAPTILGGIRIATVIGIGVATIAALIGGGGLGTLIFRGVAMVDSRLLLAGALPAAGLALTADLGFTAIERWVARRHGMLDREPRPNEAGMIVR